MTKLGALAVILACLWPALVVAQTAGDLAYQPPIAPAAPSPGPLVLRLVALTLVVLTLCVGLLRFSRYGRWSNRPAVKGNARLQHVARLNLDRRCSLHLLRVGPRRVVLGLDPSGLKSMVLLPESFAGAMRIEEAPANDLLT